jgi:hypothetical protein
VAGHNKHLVGLAQICQLPEQHVLNVRTVKVYKGIIDNNRQGRLHFQNPAQTHCQKYLFPGATAENMAVCLLRAVF